MFLKIIKFVFTFLVIPIVFIGWLAPDMLPFWTPILIAFVIGFLIASVFNSVELSINILSLNINNLNINLNRHYLFTLVVVCVLATAEIFITAIVLLLFYLFLPYYLQSYLILIGFPLLLALWSSTFVVSKNMRFLYVGGFLGLWGVTELVLSFFGLSLAIEFDKWYYFILYYLVLSFFILFILSSAILYKGMKTKCPVCQSKDLSFDNHFLQFHNKAKPLVFMKHDFLCNNCQHTWLSK